MSSHAVSEWGGSVGGVKAPRWHNQREREGERERERQRSTSICGETAGGYIVYRLTGAENDHFNQSEGSQFHHDVPGSPFSFYTVPAASRGTQ